MGQPVISRATAADRERVVDTVAAAFVADPAFQYFFRDPATFEAESRSFAGHLFDLRVASGTVWLADGGASVAMWDAPQAQVGRSAWPLPKATVARLRAYDAIVHRLLPSTPFWYLGVLATHPDSAGRRLGRAVMAAGMAAAAGAGLPSYLETCNPVNVEVYRRAGWSVAATTAVDGLDVWVMRTPAAA